MRSGRTVRVGPLTRPPGKDDIPKWDPGPGPLTSKAPRPWSPGPGGAREPWSGERPAPVWTGSSRRRCCGPTGRRPVRQGDPGLRGPPARTARERRIAPRQRLPARWLAEIDATLRGRCRSDARAAPWHSTTGPSTSRTPGARPVAWHPLRRSSSTGTSATIEDGTAGRAAAPGRGTARSRPCWAAATRPGVVTEPGAGLRQPLRERTVGAAGAGVSTRGPTGRCPRHAASCPVAFRRNSGWISAPELADLERRILHQDPTLLVVRHRSPRDLSVARLPSYDAESRRVLLRPRARLVSAIACCAADRVLVVVGPSGIGKSSFVRAGSAAGPRREGRSSREVTSRARLRRCRPGTDVLPLTRRGAVHAGGHPAERGAGPGRPRGGDAGTGLVLDPAR